MNSLCIHVAHMKVSTFNSQNLAFGDEQRVLGLPETAPAYDHFGLIVDSDGTVLSTRMRGSRASLVDKSLLCQARQQLLLRIDDLTQACQGRALVGRLAEGPNLNPNTGINEFSRRDSDGYYVTISALDAA
jgi:hypothetical protein